MSAELDPETTPGLVGLTRLQSIAKPKEDWCCDEYSNHRNPSISLTNQSSYNQSSHTNNASNDSASIHSSTYHHSSSNQSNNQANHTIINHLSAHNERPAHHHHHSNDISTEPDRSYRSKSFANPQHRTRLQSFTVIDKEDLYRQTTNNGAEPSTWSFKHLKSEFKANNFEQLFEKYQSRIQHNFYVLLLLLNIAFNLIALILYQYYDRPLSVHIGVAIVRMFSILINVLLLVFMLRSELYLRRPKSRILCSLLTLTLAFVCEYTPAVYGVVHEPSKQLLQRIRPTYFLILSNHVFLPYAKSRHAFYSTGTIIVIETALTIYTRLIKECFGMAIFWYTLADMIFHLTCALIGFFINTMLEVANRRAFLVYRSYVEGKFHLTNQMKQQDDLLHTSIPKHLSERVKDDLKQALFDFHINRNNLPCKPFNELYIEKYTEVTILYADIVNSMALAANLDAQQLVITLNELYRRFDQVTEYNKCMRIKLLGDCYYCISKGGEEESKKNHAENCVNTGLSMLDIIKDVRAKSQVDVDMRIGIHTGMVMSGLMGLYKWQYDIWSLDSMKASEMEHTGVPGMLHLTSETLNHLSYQFRNKLLIKERFDLDQPQAKITYLVKKKHEEDLSLIARLKSNKKDNEQDSHTSSLTTIKKGFDPTILIERISVSDACLDNSIAEHDKLDETGTCIATNAPSFLICSILKYREMVSYVNSILESAIDEMPLTKKEEWLNSSGIQPFFLLFRSALAKTFNLTFVEMEKRFSLQLDPLFEYYLYCAGLIGLSITLIKYCMPKMELPLALVYSLFSGLGAIVLSVVVVHYYKQKIHLVFRLLIWLIISSILICCATIDLISNDCHVADLMAENTDLINCAFTWYYAYSMVLAITSASIFIRVNHYLKLTLYIIFFTLFYRLIYDANSMVNLIDNEWNFFGHTPQISHVYYVIIVTIILHLIDRQIEYILRLEFQWMSKLEYEKKEAIHLEKVNRLLLLNILPEHIVVRYMYDQIWIAPEIPYSESYKSVAVMFASLPNYSETYAENEMNGQGLKCLQILNEIIHDFDKLILFNEQFGEVEKIKTIGSTYMAATGLCSKRDSLYDPMLIDGEEHHRTVVITMVDFAIEMLKKLQKFNKDALQDLKLRIGIAVGPVVAGVIGASKPQSIKSKMVVKNIEASQNEAASAKQCPGHVNFTSLPSDERAQIKNFITNKTLQDTLHEQARKQVCPADFCNGSLMNIPNPHENRTVEQTLLEAGDFLNQYFTFNKRANTPEHQARLESVKEELKSTGTINYTYDELSFGAKTAWRNASRCIGRIQWNKLFLNDARDIKSTKDMFDAVCRHIVYATNGGNLRSTITLFPQRVAFREDWRLWNSQLISFAGYPLEDGSVLGDPINVEFTTVCLKLGWKKPADTRTQFDVLPLIFSGPGEQPTVYELPEEIVLKVDIHHPTSNFLDDLNLQWYALPAVSAMLFDVGGVVFPAAPFNGWYMGTEIAARDFLDASRYNLGRKLARRLDLNTLNTSNLWLDRVALELNVAVLHSFQKKNVTIVDHHTASESFIKHLETETKLRGGCPGDWVWITPPMSSSLTKVFHQEMINYHLKPSYEYQKPAHKVYDWKKEPVNLKYHLKSVAQSVLFNHRMHKITLKKRPMVTILFATETGVSEHYASKLGKMLKNTFNCRVICMENYDVNELPTEQIVLFVTSTFGNGESPDNGTSFWKYVHSLQPGQIDLNRLQYSVFALGSSQYTTFCEFGKNLDRTFRKLGAHPLAGVGLADELKGQSTVFGKWYKVLYEHTCKKFNIEISSNNLEVEDEIFNANKVRLIELDDHRPEISENLNKMHNKQIVQLDAFSVEQLLPSESDKQVLLVKLRPPTEDYQLDYKPGDHLAVFPKNPTELVDRILGHLKPDTIGMFQQDIQKTTYRIELQSNGKWVPYSKLPECTLREALTNYLDICGPPSIRFLKSILPYVQEELDAQRMQKLIANHRDYEEWKHYHCPTLADLFAHFPSLKLGPKILFTQLNLLQPRYYSISSSLESTPNEVHLTMTVVTMDKKGANRKGLCTSWFAEKPTELVNCFLRKAPGFHMPENLNQPIIMVSAGSGVAPFRAFWQQGSVDQKQRGKCHKMFLFFGCRRTRLDNIYGYEFAELLTKGVILDIFYAYSRDSQHKKRYVQDQVYKQKSLIHHMLEKESAHLYVCGGAKMASGVKQAVKRLFLEEERLTEQEADDKLQKLFDENRYHEDVFGAVH